MDKKTKAGELKPVDLSIFKEGLLILRTSKDSQGNEYNSFGTLNQAAFMGERCGCLVTEIERLRDTIVLALPYVEMAEHDNGYKKGSVAEMVKQMRKQISAAS